MHYEEMADAAISEGRCQQDCEDRPQRFEAAFGVFAVCFVLWRETLVDRGYTLLLSAAPRFEP
jgi:hypothetical protein